MGGKEDTTLEREQFIRLFSKLLSTTLFTRDIGRGSAGGCPRAKANRLVCGIHIRGIQRASSIKASLLTVKRQRRKHNWRDRAGDSRRNAHD
jgi:hypothetical protein